MKSIVGVLMFVLVFVIIILLRFTHCLTYNRNVLRIVHGLKASFGWDNAFILSICRTRSVFQYHIMVIWTVNLKWYKVEEKHVILLPKVTTSLPEWPENHHNFPLSGKLYAMGSYNARYILFHLNTIVSNGVSRGSFRRSIFKYAKLYIRTFCGTQVTYKDHAFESYLRDKPYCWRREVADFRSCLQPTNPLDLSHFLKI
jgi:hypothetical protein